MERWRDGGPHTATIPVVLRTMTSQPRCPPVENSLLLPRLAQFKGTKRTQKATFCGGRKWLHFMLVKRLVRFRIKPITVKENRKLKELLSPWVLPCLRSLPFHCEIETFCVSWHQETPGDRLLFSSHRPSGQPSREL